MRVFKIFILILAPLLLHASWEILDMPTDRGFNAIWALNEQTIFVIGHQGLWKTFDGTNWVLDSTPAYPTQIYFVDDTLGFLRGWILTTDGGRTWQKGDTVVGGGGPLSFPEGQSLIGYGAGYDDVRKTEDGGWHWEILPPFPDVYPDAQEDVFPHRICFPSDPDTGYITAECVEWIPIGGGEYDYYPRYSYFKTIDGGQTWVLNEEGLYNDDFNPYLVDFPQNASVGYMTGGDGKVFKTTNGGASWDTVLIDLPHICSVCFPETDQVGYVFGDSLAHRTLDGGETWQKAVFTHDSIFGHSHFLNNSVGFITGHKNIQLCMPYDPGFVLKTTDGLLGIAEDDWVPVESSDIKVISSIGHQIVLRYSDLPHGFHAYVFNASGRKVEELHSSLQSGTITWGEGHSTGVYFIRDVSGSMAIGKVILVE